MVVLPVVVGIEVIGSHTTFVRLVPHLKVERAPQVVYPGRYWDIDGFMVGKKENRCLKVSVRREVTLLVTLAGYCVHSTVVPAIVPILFFAPTEKIV